VRIILKKIFKNWEGGKHWIGLAQERDTWWVIVNVVMNLRFPFNAENFLSSREPVSFSGSILLHWVMTLPNL